MAYQTIGRGASANDGTGDDLRTGAGKINANFVELYTLLGDGSALTSDTVVLRTAGQTLTTKSISLTDNTLTGTTAEFNTALSDDNFATLANTVTLTNKTIDLTDNTVTGTTSDFNTALSDGDFATIAGTETLTNKTLTTPDLDSPTVDDIVFTGLSENTTLGFVEAANSYTVNIPAPNNNSKVIELTNDWVTLTGDGSTVPTLSANTKYFIDVSTNAITLNLPAVSGLVDGDTITIKDAGDAGTNNITIHPDSGTDTIEGSATDVTLSTNYAVKRYVYSSTAAEWLDIS